ncbi:amidase [Xanthobacter sp. V4C-4]|uniref:amidase n=1 Tax=Xanthobacter cornucopiae TaxID=3119924 RepID=UPI003726AD00
MPDHPPPAPAPDLHDLSAPQLAALYRSRAVSPVEVTSHLLDRIDRFQPTVNAFALVDRASALAAARASERRWAEGAPLGPVDGVPAALKDLLWVKGWPTRRGSLAVDPDQPWDEDSPAAARLRAAGAVLLGKTTTSEFGWKGLADSPLTGITRNPWNLAHTPGGSSGGAAAAAALGLAPLQVATDGGGSTRLPAAFSGVFGFKPSFGRVPGYPSAHTGTLFHVAPLTRTVADAAALLEIIAQPDPRDWHALPPQTIDWTGALEAGVAGLRIAFSPTLGFAEVDPEIAETVAGAVRLLEAGGAIVEEVDPGIADPRPIFRTLWSAAAARLLATLPQQRRHLVEPGLAEIAAQGGTIGVVEYLGALEAREALGRRLALFHERYDLLVTPTTARAAPLADSDGAGGPARPVPSPFTSPFNLTQQPAASVPVGLTAAGLPIGLQLVAAKYRDDRVLRAARVLELALPFARPVDPA